MGKSQVIPFGPQHPVLPEPLHLDLVTEDEKVIKAIPQIGFIHRGLEKLVETRDYNQFVYIAERVCGICSLGHSLGYSQAIENLLGVDVPKRGEYLRIIWHELSRVHSHLLWLGLLADAFGFESLFMHCWRLREKVLDMFERTTGGRVIFSVVVPGGVTRDMDRDTLVAIRDMLSDVKNEYNKIWPAFINDSSVKNRTVDIGNISKEDAERLSMVGPFGRASGFDYDVRSFGMGAYGDLDEFEPIVDNQGDCYARIRVRCAEILQSIDIINELIDKIPAGDISVKVNGTPAKDAQASSIIEQPRGEAFYYVKSNGTKFLDRFRLRTPTSQNLAGMLSCLEGCDLADVNMLILTIDPCISCTER